MPSNNTPSTGNDSDRRIEKFLRIDTGFLDGSPDLSWQSLRDFLRDVRPPNPCSPTSSNWSRILYDCMREDPDRDRPDGRRGSAPPSLGEDARSSFNGFTRRTRRVLKDSELSDLADNRDACRTTMYITDMSPYCAAMLAIRESPEFVNVFREYLHCHLSGEVLFLALKPTAHNAASSNEWPRHVAVERKFTYEFNLPYVVLRRRSEAGPDPRRIREWAPLPEPFHEEGKYDECKYDGNRLACYSAQVSLLVVGSDEHNWKAYCNADTWFGGTKNIDQYISEDLDAPSGDARSASSPCMNPREYFLLVLSHRMRQISHEWGNVSTALCGRLAGYEGQYLRSIDADLHDDKSMSRTRAYSKAASMLRQFHDKISMTLESWEDFISHNQDLFTEQDEFEDRCGCYKTMITDEVTHLGKLRKRFFSHMERFESMRNSVLTTSLLQENRQATRQSQDIELLTKVTVAYLPLNLASAIFSIGSETPSWKIWLCWMAVCVLLGILTFTPALRFWLARFVRLFPFSTRPEPRSLHFGD